MRTLEEAFRGSTQSTPYTAALKVKICGVGPVIGYKNASGEKRLLSLGLQIIQWL